MSALSLLKKVKIQTLSFEKHPCRELHQEVMAQYLNGLALIATADGAVCEKEREYLEIIINSFGLSEDMLETFVNFAENPDEKLILDMMQSFATKDIKYNFMVDAMMIASIDGEFDESKEAIIKQYFEMFKITKKEATDLRYIYEMFYTQNGNALYRYFKRNEYMKIELFQYLLDYYEIDMAYELKEDEKKILTFEFFKPTFESGSLGNGATEIMTKPVDNAQFCIYLNSAFMDKTIEIDGNGKVVDSESKNLLMDLDNSDIKFKNNKFLVNCNEDEGIKVTGVTCLITEMFIDWQSKIDNQEYSILGFTGNCNDIKSFQCKPFYELVTNNYENGNYWYLNDNGDDATYFMRGDYNNKIDKKYTSNKSSFRMMKSTK
jgi:uncharacterized tellurite resistance protein B-like protein